MTATQSPTEWLEPQAEHTEHTARVERLNAASLRRIVEPDDEVTGTLTKDQVVPDELLSVAGLGLDLSPEQRATLSREELASIVRFGILFEAVLMSGFAYQLALSPDVTDPRFTYALHEMGEETRHSRLFVRLVDELAPMQRNPLNSRLAARVRSRMLPLLLRRPATLDALVLVGEEIPTCSRNSWPSMPTPTPTSATSAATTARRRLGIWPSPAPPWASTTGPPPGPIASLSAGSCPRASWACSTPWSSPSSTRPSGSLPCAPGSASAAYGNGWPCVSSAPEPCSTP